ncbi:MAG: glycosyltransferase family A protein [Pseudomonadota bacterium]
MSEGIRRHELASVSVIVPTYNRARFLGESLDAIIGQLAEQDEIIVVNDGSEDDTGNVLNSYSPNVRIIEQANAGKSAALNHALPEATGDFVWIVDDDDIVCPDARNRLVDALLATPNAGLAYGRHDRFIDDVVTGQRRFLDTGYWCDCEPEEFLCATLEDFFVHQPGMMVRRELYQTAGPFAEVYSEDYDMLIRLAKLAEPISIPGILFHQRQHDGIRGSAAEPVKIERRNDAWINVGQMIISHHMKELPLEMFVAERKLDNEIATRRALLQRAVIFARHGLWMEAAREFTQAAEQSPYPLTDIERDLIKRVSFSKFEMESFLADDAAKRQFSILAKSKGVGRSIVRRIGRSLVWRIRESHNHGRPFLATKYAQRAIQMWILGR